MFVLGTKNSSGHVQTNFLFGKVPNILKKFPTFCVDIIPSPPVIVRRGEVIPPSPYKLVDKTNLG